MRFEQSDAASPEMAYHPFLLQRQNEVNMSSLLAQQNYLPGLGLPSPYPFGLPKFPGSLMHPYTTAEDVLSFQGSASGRSMRNAPMEDDGVTDDPKVTLESKELWEQFHELGTEMVITKSGR